MKRAFYIVSLVVATMIVACSGGSTFLGGSTNKRVVATVDDKKLTLGDILDNMPQDFVGADSATFVRMYTDNWVLNQLKLARAEEVLASHEDIDRLVEGYRQSLIMRQLDQYYVDKELDTEITDRQILAHYRTNSSQFVLDHDMVRGVIVRVGEEFRNSSALGDAMRSVTVEDMQELTAFAEKHSLQITDLVSEWVTYADFLSYLPTVRTRSYDKLLQVGKVQSMKTDDVVFYFVIVDVVRTGGVIPLECVEDDIRRMLYAERSAEIIRRYEQKLKYDGIEDGRVEVDDESLFDAMSNLPKINDGDVTVGEAQDVVREKDIDTKRKKKEEDDKENTNADTKSDSKKESKQKSEDKAVESDKTAEKQAEKKSEKDGEQGVEQNRSTTESKSEERPAATSVENVELKDNTKSESKTEIEAPILESADIKSETKAETETKVETKSEATTTDSATE